MTNSSNNKTVLATGGTPNWLVHLFAVSNPGFNDITARFGRNKKASNKKAKKLPGWQPRNHEEVILAAAGNLFH